MTTNCYDVHIENQPIHEKDQLVVVRFPAMESQFKRNSSDHINLSYKPKSMRFKLEVTLDGKSGNYYVDQARDLGEKSAPKSFPHEDNRVDRNVYASSKTPVEDGQLFACKLINNKLVCRPLSHLLTFRSDFSHFDLKDEVDPKEEVRPVSVKFAAPERQTHNNTSKTLNDNQQDQDDSADEFQTIRYRKITSSEAEQQRIMLFGTPLPKVKPDPDQMLVDKKPTGIELMADIKPKIERMDVDEIYSNESTSLNSSPRKVTLIRQRVKDCLIKAKLVSFEEVYHFIKSNDLLTPGENVQLSNKDILDSLSDLALLVQGNWAVKSEVLYGDSSERDSTDVTGISINLFISARDYLLWLFTQNRFVSRVEFSKKVRMPDHDTLQLFTQLGQFRREIRSWELKLPTDNRFLKQFPDVVQRQAAIWKVRKANKLSMFT